MVDWNVNGFALKDQIAFLKARSWDIALLQEVTKETWPRFRELGGDGGVATPPILEGAGHKPGLAPDE